VKGKINLITLALLLSAAFAGAQFKPPTAPARELTGRTARDKEIAAAFAPVIYQGLGEQPRSDYITNFDFDGDWRGDNNWLNAGNKRYALPAYVYYSVIETATHYFVHYAFFHPRDYKGGIGKSTLVDILIKEGVRRAGKDPTGLADDVALSHENDLEGALIVAEKRDDDVRKAAVQYVETLAHNRYLKYRPQAVPGSVGEIIEMNDQRPLLFVEPKGHGVTRYSGHQERKSLRALLVYSYTGTADDPDKRRGDAVGYELVPIQETLWQQAQAGENDMFGEAAEYQPFTVLMHRLGAEPSSIERTLGKLGSAFRGNVGFKNKARPPWGWFDDTEKDRPRGEWFFHPAAVIARHFNLEQTFPQAYVYHPYLKIGVAESER
jgi:hypothetical protein